MIIFDFYLYGIHIAPTYYGLMYAMGFILWYIILNKKKYLNKDILDILLIYIILWVILWWRLWYVLFYDISYYINWDFNFLKLLNIFKIWEWWMSFHWWVLGVLIAMILFSRKYKLNFYNLADNITLVVPIWLFFWRIWNYLNKELLWFSWYNSFLSVNWRFPSPLLEAFLEWIVLFIILFLVDKKKKFYWEVASLFLIFYSLFRIFVEIFFRKPDAHIWYIFGFLTVWEILSLFMLMFWIFYFLKLKNKVII